MKKFLFAVIAGCSLLAGQVHADALSILQNTRIKAQQTVSIQNLASLFQTVANYVTENKKYPSFTELNLPPGALANPYHGLGVEQKVPDKITEANSGYAYFGAALNGTGAAGALTTTPLAFEKPAIRPDGKVAVLYLSGKVQVVDVKAQNCAEVIAALKKQVKDPKAAVWEALEKAATTLDEAK